MPEEDLDGASQGLPLEAGLFSGGPYSCRAYGLAFSSEIRFPQWPDVPAAEEADVFIRRGVIFGQGYVPPSSVQIESSPGRLLLRGSKSATILVSGGNAITVELLPRVNPLVVRQLILGWALAGIFHQRHMLPLHGSALCAGDACFVVCAASGAGKSTLAAAFLNAGHTYLDDNVALVEFRDGIPFVVPGIPEIRLWEDALQEIAFEHTVTGRLESGGAKLAILARANFRNSPALLKKIFILRRTQDARLSCERLAGAAKFRALLEHVFCLRFMGDAASRPDLFRNLQALAAKVVLAEIRLPARLPRPDELCAMVLDMNGKH